MTDRAGPPQPSTELALRSAFLPIRVGEPEAARERTLVEIMLPAGPTVRVTRGFVSVW
jgi:hypothetical protein